MKKIKEKLNPETFSVIDINITRSMVYKMELAPKGTIFYIAKLTGEKKRTAEVKYTINKAWEDTQTEESVKRQIQLELQKQLKFKYPIVEMPAQKVGSTVAQTV